VHAYETLIEGKGIYKSFVAAKKEDMNHNDMNEPIEKKWEFRQRN